MDVWVFWIVVVVVVVFTAMYSVPQPICVRAVIAANDEVQHAYLTPVLPTKTVAHSFTNLLKNVVDLLLIGGELDPCQFTARAIPFGILQ